MLKIIYLQHLTSVVRNGSLIIWIVIYKMRVVVLLYKRKKKGESNKMLLSRLLRW